jgi:hypothetical protein
MKNWVWVLLVIVVMFEVFGAIETREDSAFPAIVPNVVYAQTGGPYLTCDPYPSGAAMAMPDDFVVVLNGATHYSAAMENPDGSRYLWFDLEGLWEAGQNTTLVWARNVWGESGQTPFDFVAGVPQIPANPRVAIQ